MNLGALTALVTPTLSDFLLPFFGVFLAIERLSLDMGQRTAREWREV